MGTNGLITLLVMCFEHYGKLSLFWTFLWEIYEISHLQTATTEQGTSNFREIIPFTYFSNVNYFIQAEKKNILVSRNSFDEKSLHLGGREIFFYQNLNEFF